MKELNTILRVCISFMGHDFTDKGKMRDNVFKRWIYFQICRKLTVYSQARIGEMVKKDHASVTHGLKMFPRDILTDDHYCNLYRRCMLTSRNALKQVEMSYNDKLLHENINLRQKVKELEAGKFEKLEVICSEVVV